MRDFSVLTLLLLVPFAAICVMTSSAKSVVETYVYVDDLAVKNWKSQTGKGIHSDMETEIQSMMEEVNKIYEDLNIEIVVKEISFTHDPVVSPNAAGETIATASVSLFENWLRIMEQTTNDLSILLTGAKLTSALPSDPLGIANIAEICNGPRSAAVIHMYPTFRGTLVMAHEIGHVFGARHDGDGNTCDPKQEYLMIYSLLLTENRYKLSTCSKNSIQTTFYNLQINNQDCTADHQDETSPQVPMYGSLMSADAVCKRRYGSRAYVKRDVYSGSYGDSVCLQLVCEWVSWKTKKLHASKVPSPDGLHCGKNKQCVRGKCIVTPTGLPTVSDACPFGDQPLIMGTYPKACGQIDSSECPKWKNICCQTCNEKNPEFSKTGDDACRRLEGETSQMYRYYNNASEYEDLMCRELRCLKADSLVNNKFQWNGYKAPDGLACGKDKRCHDGQCIASTNGNPDIKDYCPFGDQPWFAGKLKTTCDSVVWRGGCKSWGRFCCETCQGKR